MTKVSQEIFHAMNHLKEAIQGLVSLGVIASSSDIECQHEYINQNYLKIMLEYLHRIETAFDHVMETLQKKAIA